MAEKLTPAQRQWVTALRSGDYSQGIIHLNSTGGMCCLGVACHIFAEELGLTVTTNGRYIEYGSRTHYPPEQIVKHLGLVDKRGQKRGDGAYKTRLTNLNDEGTSFDDIANLIETGDYFKE